MEINLDQILDNACRDLPNNWTITIEIHGNYGGIVVLLHDPQGVQIPIPDEVDYREEIMGAVAVAQMEDLQIGGKDPCEG